MIARILSCALLLMSWSCMHTADEKQKLSFEATAEDRIESMEDNAQILEKRAKEQIDSTLKGDFQTRITTLKRSTSEAKAELAELRARDVSTWVEKKPAVDRKLYEMEDAYNEALDFIESH